MRKIVYVSGSRSDYGLMRSVLFSIRNNPKLNLEVIACGMHLMKDFGSTFRMIKQDSFRVHKINIAYKYGIKAETGKFAGELIKKTVALFSKIKPDIVLLLGDRPEMLAAAVAAVYMDIPVAHIHGGDISSTVDEVTRHSITKLANLHFAATERSASRIVRMGENKWRVFNVGAPGVDGILNEKLYSKNQIAKIYGLDLNKPVILAVQHPVTLEEKKAGRQIRITLDALKELKLQAIVIYPNADAGSRKIIKEVKRIDGKSANIRVFKSLPHKDFLSLMNISSVIVGNSSAAFIEAPSLGLPAVNIGTRQKGREDAGNIINIGYSKKQLLKAIRKSIFDHKFRTKVKGRGTPYGDGRAGLRIARVLSSIKLDRKLLEKRIAY